MSTAGESHTATMLANGKVLVVGGIDKAGAVADIHYLATAEIFDPANGTFTAAGNMEIERSDHAATLLKDGRVLITGGINSDNSAYLNSLGPAELFP
jgi:N-acetylneuraminic acid mutarotase